MIEFSTANIWHFLWKQDTLVDSIQQNIYQELECILKNTYAKIEVIISSKNQDIVEALARPDYKDCKNLQINNQFSEEKKQKEALFYMLNLVEKNKLTFELFQHMLHMIDEKIINNTDKYKKYAINAYPADIQHPDFLQTIENFPYSDMLIIELTEKYEWSETVIENLKYVQKHCGVEIAMDDIHPIHSDVNSSMKSLNQFKTHGLNIDRAKIDGLFFKEMYEQNSYDIFVEIIRHIYNEYGLDKFTIEWIETFHEYNFAKQLEKDFPYLEFRYQGFYFNENS